MLKSIKFFNSVLLVLSAFLALNSCSKENLPENPVTPVEKITISFSSGGNGKVTPEGINVADEGSTLSSVAIPETDYKLEGWYDGEQKIVDGDNYTIDKNTLKVKLTQAIEKKSYQARFSKFFYTVNFECTPTGDGTIDLTVDSAAVSEKIISTATPKGGYAVIWYDYDNKPITKTEESSDFYVSQDGLKLTVISSLAVHNKTFKAEFLPLYTVTFNSEKGGTVYPTSGSATDGVKISSTATANGEYTFAGWYDKKGVQVIETSGDIYVNGSVLYINSSSAVNTESFTARFIKGSPRLTVKDGILAITYDPNDYAAYFQFGSVIAWDGNAGATSSNVLFNPTGSPITAWKADWTVGSSFPTQTLDNIRRGQGDPCRLVGLTQNDFDKNKVDNGIWRLPSKEENIAYAQTHSTWTKFNDTYGYYIGPEATESGIGGEFFPAAGYRSKNEGTLAARGEGAGYWSNSLSGETGITLAFTQSSLYPENEFPQAMGHPIRCVRQY
ncbi:MAG: InlB B-repeat-containing protein [Phocaeicola sp.]